MFGIRKQMQSVLHLYVGFFTNRFVVSLMQNIANIFPHLAETFEMQSVSHISKKTAYLKVYVQDQEYKICSRIYSAAACNLILLL